MFPNKHLLYKTLKKIVFETDFKNYFSKLFYKTITK